MTCRHCSPKDLKDALGDLEAELIQLEMAGEIMMHMAMNEIPEWPYFFARVDDHAKRLRGCFNHVWETTCRLSD